MNPELFDVVREKQLDHRGQLRIHTEGATVHVDMNLDLVVMSWQLLSWRKLPRRPFLSSVWRNGPACRRCLGRHGCEGGLEASANRASTGKGYLGEKSWFVS